MSLGRLLTGNIIYRILNIVANVLITVLLTRLMTVEGYGVLSLLVANASIFSLVSCLGAESGINYHYASGGLARGKIFTIIYRIIFFQLALLAVVEVMHHSMTGHYWLAKGSEIKFLFWGMLYVFSLSLIDKYTAFLNGSHQYTLANKMIFASNLLALFVFGGLYFFYGTKGYFFYLQGFILVTFIQAIMLLFVFHRPARQPLKFESPKKADLKLFFSYSFLAFITNIIQFLAYRIDFWLINYYQGKDALGWYSLAVKLGQLFWVLPILFASIILPQVADKTKEYDQSKFLYLLRVTNAVLFSASLIALALAGWFIPLFFSQAFQKSVEPFLYLLPGFFLFSINIMVAAWFAGKNQLLVNFIGTVICFVLAFLLDLWLIPLTGIRGAAIASSIAYSASAIYSLVRFCIFTHTSLRDVLFLQPGDRLRIKTYFKNIFHS